METQKITGMSIACAELLFLMIQDLKQIEADEAIAKGNVTFAQLGDAAEWPNDNGVFFRNPKPRID